MSSFSEGQIHQLAEALETAGFTRQDITLLGQFKDKAGLLRILRGEAVVVEPQRPQEIPEEIDCRLLAQYCTPDAKITWENFRKCLKPKWREQDGIVYLSVTSNGLIGEQWIECLEGKGLRIKDHTKRKLRSCPSFKPTNGVTTQIAVLKGLLFEDGDRVTKKIRLFAVERKLAVPNTEVVCLIRDRFSDEEIEAMGLIGIVTMHESIIEGWGDYPYLLGADRSGGGQKLDSYWDGTDGRWPRGYGFAFVAPPAHQRAGK